MKSNPATREPMTIASCRRQMATCGCFVALSTLTAFLDNRDHGNTWHTMGQLLSSNYIWLLFIALNAGLCRRIANGETILGPSAKTVRLIYLVVFGTVSVGGVIVLGFALWLHDMSVAIGALAFLIGLLTAMYVVSRTGDSKAPRTPTSIP